MESSRFGPCSTAAITGSFTTSLGSICSDIWMSSRSGGTWAGMAGQESVYERADCFENLQLSFFIGEVVAGTVKIDFDAREAKPGKQGTKKPRDQIPDFSR